MKSFFWSFQDDNESHEINLSKCERVVSKENMFEMHFPSGRLVFDYPSSVRAQEAWDNYVKQKT